MVICFDATLEAHNALKALLSSGRYPDSSVAISTALSNQALLDAAVQKAGGTLIPDVSGASTEGVGATKVARPPVAQSLGVPELFSQPLTEADSAAFVTAPAAEPTDAPGGPKDWLWGQFNKLLPLKTTTRALFNILSEDANTSSSEAANRITAASAQLAALLRQIDKTRGYAREDALASAFPSDTQSKEKSMIRFCEQFVFGSGSFATSSLPFEFRFVAVPVGRKDSIRLTPEGAAFAALRNPLLDADAAAATAKFSPEELSFLRGHVLKAVTAERAALIALLSGIRAGSNSPETLDAYLREQFPQQASTLTPALLATQRSGAIARAIDLMLIRRRREGVRVFYEVEQAGHDFYHAAHPS
jgi:hypothetical protein